MRGSGNSFVVCNSKYFNKQGRAYFETDRILIGLRDEEYNIVYPHPISAFIYKNYHRKSGSINTERAPAQTIVHFLNFVLINNNKKNRYSVSGIHELNIHHANRYLEHCVKEKANLLNTLDTKERHISAFYSYLDKEGVLKKKPPFIESTYIHGNQKKTSYSLDFAYKKTDETLLRRKVKRKDMVPQQHNHKEERQIIRLNLIREFLLIAMEVAKDIAFGIALQFYAGLRKGEVLNLDRSSIRTLEGGKYGERGMIVMVRDRQNELFPNKKSRNEEQVKNPRDQSVLIDPILCLLYEHHMEKVLKNKHNKQGNALFYNSDGSPMAYSSYYKRFRELQSSYYGVLLTTKGRYQDYLDFFETNWSSHMGRGAFTNMCLDAGFSSRQTAILRGDKSVMSMESYQDQISAAYNITRALGLLEPGNSDGLVHLDIPTYQK